MKIFCSYTFGLLTVALVAGCDSSPRMNYDAVGLVDVSGSVTLDGQPLPNAVVTFENADGQFSYAQTNSDGQYVLQFDSQESGVAPGEKIVRISTTRKILGLNTEDESAGEAPPGEESSESGSPPAKEAEKVPARYNKDSELKRTVKPNESQTFDFELTTK